MSPAPPAALRGALAVEVEDRRNQPAASLLGAERLAAAREANRQARPPGRTAHLMIPHPQRPVRRRKPDAATGRTKRKQGAVPLNDLVLEAGRCEPARWRSRVSS